MSDPGIVVVVDENGYEAYGGSWIAKRLATSLFWGLEPFLSWVYDLDRLDTLLNHQIAGVLIDLHRHTLIFNDTNDHLLLDVSPWHRRMYFALLQYTWPGWRTQWAYDDNITIADYLGIPRESLYWHPPREQDKEDFPPLSTFDQPRRRGINDIGSIRREDGTVGFKPIDMSWLKYGPALLSVMQEQANQGIFPLEEATGGFHIDVPQKTLSFWGGYSSPGHDCDYVRFYWQGWKVHWLEDNFEQHVALTDNRLYVSPPAPETLITEIAVAFGVKPTDGINSVTHFLTQFIKHGHSIVTNPATIPEPRALFPGPYEGPVQLREHAFNYVIYKWLESQGKMPPLDEA